MMTETIDPRHLASDDYLALARGAAEHPDHDVRRLVMADWIEDHGGTVLPWLIRHPSDTDATRAYARFLTDRCKVPGIAEFARVQTAGKTQKDIDREYDLLRRHWRQWFPANLTTLKATADRRVVIEDHFAPYLRVPTRGAFGRRVERPCVRIGTFTGMPNFCSADQVDWDRFGAELLARFPWVSFAPARTAGFDCLRQYHTDDKGFWDYVSRMHETHPCRFTAERREREAARSQPDEPDPPASP